jgi:uncharacterized membrane protein
METVAAGSRISDTGGRSLSDIEERLSGRVLAWVGGIALVLGGAFFLSLAFSRGWIGPEARVTIGLIAAALAIALGAWLFDRSLGTPALVLVASGIGIGMLSLYAATRLYGFVPVEVGLVASLVIAVAAAAIGVRANSQAVATLGLVAAIAAPPILGAPANLVAVAFLGTALVGVAAISMWRSWSWPPILAFLFAAPQVAAWITEGPGVALALAGLTLFTTVNAVAAAGEGLIHDRPRLHRGAAALMVLNALFAIGAARYILVDVAPAVRLAALLILAAGHAALAAQPLIRSRGRDPLGVLAAGVAVGILAIAIGLELGAIYRPIAWTALATGLAWSAIRFRHGPAAWAAAVIGGLAGLHLVLVEYPVREFLSATVDGVPFASPEGIVAFSEVAAILLVTAIARRAFAHRDFARPVRRAAWLTADAAGAIGVTAAWAIAAYAAPFELSATGTTVAWAALGGLLFAVAHRARRDAVAWQAAVVAGSVFIAIAAIEALSVAPLERLAVDAGRVAVFPLVNDATLALLAVVGAFVAAARAAVRRSWTSGSLGAAAAVLVYLLSITIVDAFQWQVGVGRDAEEIARQAQVALTITWVLVGAVSFTTGLRRSWPEARMFGLGLLGLATAKVFLVDLGALDVAYRVLSLVGLGIVLLGSSLVAARLRTSTVSGSAPEQR